MARTFGGPVTPFATIQEAVEEFRCGNFVLILDEERENEGDLAMAAEHVTPSAINFLATHARGLICMPMMGQRLDALDIPPMVPTTSVECAAFTVSVDARRGTTTGISAEDRAWTVKTLIHPLAQKDDLVRPGHMFPLRYTKGGVLRRAGHTEAAVDLAILAGCYPAAVICEVMATDGTMARRLQLDELAHTHGIALVSVSQLIAHRQWTERIAVEVGEAVAAELAR